MGRAALGLAGLLTPALGVLYPLCTCPCCGQTCLPRAVQRAGPRLPVTKKVPGVGDMSHRQGSRPLGSVLTVS